MDKPNLIVLLTDFGLYDPFVGIMKGVIKSVNPSVEIIDLSHQVKPHSIKEGAFFLYISYKYFPKGSIFVVVVDPGVGSEREILLYKTSDYYFLAPNNGVLSYILPPESVVLKIGGETFKFFPKSEDERIVKIENENFFLKPVSRTFHGRDIFAPVAAYISLGVRMEEFGEEFKGEMIKIPFPRLKYIDQKLYGEVIYSDRFGNLITNIDEESLNKFLNGLKPIINFKNVEIFGLKNSYSEAKKGEPLAIINSFNYLEISVREGSAVEKFLAKEGDEIIVEKI